ncbi:hypothetical protein H4R20_002017 [Coemansia guatemalensis]|uniref:Grh/CP2 DB domain-containing protein n=1 Tax=Coemansia guatemalensis TaxID=2761395 RepID=A0A9W8I275_9FUNG|nr:hypothetical protein H4R20_002017 [Coemansia guatemalensis]
MSSIPAGAASYYAAYNLGGERRDGADGMISTSTVQSLAAHDLFQHQPAQAQQPHRQHPQPQSPTHTPISQYHHPQHQPQQPHVAVPQYHPQHPHASSVPSHHASVTAAVGDATSAYHATTYQPGAFVPYAHTAYHTHQPPVSHPVSFDSAASTAVDAAPAMMAVSTATATAAAAANQDYSMMAAANAFNVTASSAQSQSHQQHQTAHPNAAGSNGMRFEYILEAPTAAAQKADEPAMTYLNRGQLYGVTMMDKTNSDAFYSTTLRIAFHEDSHRKSAATYWNFWLNQQEDPHVARAVELDKAGSIGVVSTENKWFDRLTFQWQGRRGAKVMVRFNCLSTDFSRIKGVKGIPLRIHLDTHYALTGAVNDAAALLPPVAPLATSSSVPMIGEQTPAPTDFKLTGQLAVSGSLSTPVSPLSASGPSLLDQYQNQNGNSATATFAAMSSQTSMQGTAAPAAMLSSGRIIERSYARIKLFRDKGAERKNKDDQRHLDRLWAKQKAKLASNGSSAAVQQQQLAEFTMSFAVVQPVTYFTEHTLTNDKCDSEGPLVVDDIWSPSGTASATLAAAATLESPDSSASTPIANLSSMNIGIPAVHLGGHNPSLSGATAAMSYMRKRGSEDFDAQSSNKRQFSSSPNSTTEAVVRLGPNNTELVGVDPTYVPVARKRKSVLVIYVRFQGENVYRAVYLEQLAVEDLVAKLAERLEIQATASDILIVRKTSKGLTIKVDDHVVEELVDEQDMEVECSFADDTGALTIYLHY